jgi:predicted dinucleotide-binding enzyme
MCVVIGGHGKNGAMNIGIVGSGEIGRTLGRLWARAGHRVYFSFSHDKRKLEDLARECGGDCRAVTPYDAVRCSEIVLFAVPWNAIDEAIKQIGRFEGQVVIDATNPIAGGQVQRFDENDSSSESVARKLENAKVIKAFNTLSDEVLWNRSGKGLVIFVAGDFPVMKTKVGELIKDAGFVPFDVGPLRAGKNQEPGTDRFMKELTLDQAQELTGMTQGVRSIVGEIDLDQPVRKY